MSEPDNHSELPEFDLNITSTTVKAKPRKLSCKWVVGPTAETAPLEELAAALDDPSYNPDDQASVERWRSRRRVISSVEDLAMVKPFRGEQMTADDIEVYLPRSDTSVGLYGLDIYWSALGPNSDLTPDHFEIAKGR